MQESKKDLFLPVRKYFNLLYMTKLDSDFLKINPNSMVIIYYINERTVEKLDA